jgi:uncharacterized protein
VLKVADLVDRPGASRRLDLAMALPEGFELPLVELIEPVRLAGILESVVDGILLRGTLGVEVRLSCARCLIDVPAQLQTEVVELYRDPETVAHDDEPVEEGYELRDGHIDLDGLLRDALAPAIPVRPLCDEACKGLCEHCGTNLNEATCDCADAVPDGRWAALANLRLPDVDDEPTEGQI